MASDLAKRLYTAHVIQTSILPNGVHVDTRLYLHYDAAGEVTVEVAWNHVLVPRSKPTPLDACPECGHVHDFTREVGWSE